VLTIWLLLAAAVAVVMLAAEVVQAVLEQELDCLLLAELLTLLQLVLVVQVVLVLVLE
jgi:hypothetical protein